jgi:hypothetical protein
MRLDEALASYDNAIANKHDHAKAYFNKSMSCSSMAILTEVGSCMSGDLNKQL